MDITSPLNSNLQLPLNKIDVDGLNLKIGQLLNAKVIETQILLDTLTLKVGDKTLFVQADRPVSLQSGQSLQLQVVKLLPQAEFKMAPTLPSQLSTPTDTVTLKLLSQPLATQQPTSTNTALSALQTGEQLPARIVNVTDNKITLQLLPTLTNKPNAQAQTNIPADKLLITLDTKQLLFPNPSSRASPSTLNTAIPNAAVLEAGAQVTLQAIKTAQSPTYAILPAIRNSEQQIQAALKQLLPIQASPTALLTHLQLALPHLQQTDTSVAETLKNLAQLILQSTPSKTQLTEATQLKQTVNESGLFLEAKLAELLSGKQEMSFQEDFKLKLGKLIQFLNQEVAAQPENKLSEDNELLKQSLQKAQSALAKLTLDQLNSLPRDESPKQCWTLELPFFHNQTPESVKIEIEQDKANHSDNSQKNWAVSITITPPDLATIHCKISCYDGSVNTRFWSEAAGTVEKINAHLDYLKQQFELKGLTSGFMQAQQGLPAQSDSIVNTPLPALLSEKV